MIVESEKWRLKCPRNFRPSPWISTLYYYKLNRIRKDQNYKFSVVTLFSSHESISTSIYHYDWCHLRNTPNQDSRIHKYRNTPQKEICSETTPPHHQSLNRECRLGTTDDSATSFLNFSLFSTALWDLPNSRPVHSLMLSSHLFLCLPCLLPPFTVPCKMVLARPDERET